MNEVQLSLDELSKVFIGQDEMLQSHNAEYSKLIAAFTTTKLVDEEKEKVSIADIIKLIQDQINPEGLKLEIVSRW